MEQKTAHILQRHIYWSSIGLSLKDILEVKASFKNSFSQASTLDIERYLMVKNNYVMPTSIQVETIDHSKITFLYINDEDFNGDIEFITRCTNLTHIYIDGYTHQFKIKSLEYFRKLNKLEFLNLSNNDIEDLEPLGELTNLKSLWVSGNNVENIQPISNLSNLQELFCSYSSHKDVYDLLKNAKDCNVSYLVKDEEFSYETTRVGDLHFKYKRRESYDSTRSIINIEYTFSMFSEPANEGLKDSNIEAQLSFTVEDKVNQYILKLKTKYNQDLSVRSSNAEFFRGQYVVTFELNG